MSEPVATFAELLAYDPRYKIEAYLFVQRGLAYAHRVLGLGSEQPTERAADDLPPDLEFDDPGMFDDEDDDEPLGDEPAPRVDRHLTGQELCEAIRQYALEEFGYMAKVVLNSWGVTSTGDFGEIVYNMIRIGLMRKSKHDRREDFDDVYDFEDAFQRRFRFALK